MWIVLRQFGALRIHIGQLIELVSKGIYSFEVFLELSHLMVKHCKFPPC